MTERDDQFYDLGFTDPDKLGELRNGHSDTKRSPRSKHYRHRAYGPSLGEDSGVGYEGGIPPELQPRIVLSDEQLARNALGIALVKQALADARKASAVDVGHEAPTGTPAEQAALRDQRERQRLRSQD